MKADTKDIIGGGAIALAGGCTFYIATGYNIGTAAQMGPGFFPIVVSGFLILLGLLIMGFAFLRSGAMPMPAWRQLIAVLVSVLVFAFTVSTLGLVPAVMAVVICSALGDKAARPMTTFLLAVSLSIATWILFAKLLGLAMPALLWPVIIY